MFFLREQFSFPEELAQAFCLAQWGKHPSEQEITRLGKSLRVLWQELALHRGFHAGDSHYSFKKDQVEAYASYYLPANALKNSCGAGRSISSRQRPIFPSLKSLARFGHWPRNRILGARLVERAAWKKVSI